MPRGPRLDAPGVLQHVMVRGIERRKLFLDNHDRDDFLRRMAALTDAGALAVYAWALMPNHFHLLVRTGSRPLPRSMRSLLTGLWGALINVTVAAATCCTTDTNQSCVKKSPIFWNWCATFTSIHSGQVWSEICANWLGIRIVGIRRWLGRGSTRGKIREPS